MASLDWPVKLIRDTFFTHFDLNHYTLLSPSPLIEVEDSTVSPIHTYLNQFKRTVDGVVQIDSRRSSCYSLRCISTRGDDAGVMDNFRENTSYHRFSELLGSWASGEYKEEAIKLSWELLTQRYKLPRNKIYIKYFGGNTESCLGPDVESLDMWKRYVPKERILPSMSKADFWRAGDTGPCGPSVGILFDLCDSKDNPPSVANINDDRFVEIWRLVFVQFNRQEDGVLRPLHVRHVITGMNVECLAAILQNKRSHYDSDVFTDILAAIQFGAGDGAAQYSGKVGNDDSTQVDTAYRLIADHLRMISAATSYCAQLGLQTEDREYLLKHADRCAVVFGHKILNTKFDHYEIALNSAIRTAGFYPMQMDAEKIASIVKAEAKIYKKIREKDEQGVLFVDCNPAMTDSNLHPSLPPRKKAKKNKNKNQRGKQQQKRPTQPPPASSENEDDKLDEIDDMVGPELEIKSNPENEHKNLDEPDVPRFVGLEFEITSTPEKEDKKLEETDVPNVGGPEMEISTSPKSVASVHNTGVVYNMRQINLLGRSTHIIYQDENGPCPLIAICNCLLLKGKIRFESHLNEVPMEHLVFIIKDLLKQSLKLKVCYSFAKGSILDVVPTLAKGLDIDVKFNRTDGFTATLGTMLFDCLEIPLYHGWLPDEEDMAGVLSHSFETLTWAVKEPHFPNVETVKKFLNGRQLTAYGLACLHRDVIENFPSVHYWNMHFSTIIKFNGALYSLVTDAGYIATNVVWQMLNEINSGGPYMSSDFTPIDLELGATPSVHNMGKKIRAPLGFVPETSSMYFKSSSKRHSVISLKKFIAEPGNEFSVKRTLFPAGTPLAVAATTRTGRVMALDILMDLIGAHSTDRSYNGAFGLSSIFVLHSGRAAICAPFCDECTDATKSKDFEIYISDIIEIFRIDEVGLPAFFTHLISLLRRPGSFMQLRYFWDCVLTTLALKPPLSRAGLFSGIHRIRRFAPAEVQIRLKSVLRHCDYSDDWREHIYEGHPLLKKVLQHILAKSPEDKGDPVRAEEKKKFGLFHRNLYSLSIFPRKVNEHGKPKDEGSKDEGGTQGVEEVGEEPFELLSDLDLLYSHYLENSLPLVLEMLLSSPSMSTELWEWVKEVLQEYDKPEAMEPALWDR